eukprot:COSAG06_NODE_8244_length_2219_cov_1.708843_2_plen_51_part_00
MAMMAAAAAAAAAASGSRQTVLYGLVAVGVWHQMQMHSLSISSLDTTETA